MSKIAFVAAAPYTIEAFLRGHIETICRQHEVHIVVNLHPPTGEVRLGPFASASVHHVPMQRRISIIRDILSLVELFLLLRRERFDAVISMAPKSGLIAMSCAWLLRIPLRIHFFTGQVWVTRRFFVRRFLRLLDRWIASAATDVLVDSHSQRVFLFGEGVLPAGKGEVLGQGSVAGVDISRFAPSSDTRRRLRHKLGIDLRATVILYLGRLTPDKGLLDLGAAFVALMEDPALARTALLIVGPDEGGMTIALRELCATVGERLKFEGYTDHPESYMQASDLVVLPSYREGFGTVIIEAAATGLPAVATRIYGVTDAVVDGVTGVLYAPRNVAALTAAMRTLIKDAALRQRMGADARTRAIREFRAERLRDAMLSFLNARLAGCTRAVRSA